MTCSHHILETPLMNFCRVLLFHPATMLRFGWYDLFVYRMTLVWVNLYVVISNETKTWSHPEKFAVWVFCIISMIIIIYLEKISQCFLPFQCHSHGNCFISKFAGPVQFVLGHFGNSHSHLGTKEHLNFFSIRFHWFSLCWTLYRFVGWGICSKILSSQNSLKYYNDVISAAFSNGGLNSFLLNEVSKTIDSFFLHLQIRFSFILNNFLPFILSSVSSLVVFAIYTTS